MSDARARGSEHHQTPPRQPRCRAHPQESRESPPASASDGWPPECESTCPCRSPRSLKYSPIRRKKKAQRRPVSPNNQTPVCSITTTSTEACDTYQRFLKDQI